MTHSRKFILKLVECHSQDVMIIEHVETTINSISGCLISLVKNFPEHGPQLEDIRVTLLEELKLFKNEQGN